MLFLSQLMCFYFVCPLEPGKWVCIANKTECRKHTEAHTSFCTSQAAIISMEISEVDTLKPWRFPWKDTEASSVDSLPFLNRKAFCFCNTILSYEKFQSVLTESRAIKQSWLLDLLVLLRP